MCYDSLSCHNLSIISNYTIDITCSGLPNENIGSCQNLGKKKNQCPIFKYQKKKYIKILHRFKYHK